MLILYIFVQPSSSDMVRAFGVPTLRGVQAQYFLSLLSIKEEFQTEILSVFKALIEIYFCCC